MIAGVKALPELHTISASSIARIGGTICFSVKPSATLAPVLTTCEQPVKAVVVITMAAIPWHICWTFDIFLSSIIVIMSMLLNIADELYELKSIYSKLDESLCH
jgi:hypothetical protein